MAYAGTTYGPRLVSGPPVRTALAATARTLAATVLNGNSNRRIRVVWRLKNATASGRSLTLKFNGATTGVTMQQGNVSGSTVGGSSGLIGLLRASADALVVLDMPTKYTASSLRRMGVIQYVANQAGQSIEIAGYGVVNWESSDVMTSVEIDGGAADTLAIGSEVTIEEYSEVA